MIIVSLGILSWVASFTPFIIFFSFFQYPPPLFMFFQALMQISVHYGFGSSKFIMLWSTDIPDSRCIHVGVCHMLGTHEDSCKTRVSNYLFTIDFHRGHVWDMPGTHVSQVRYVYDHAVLSLYNVTQTDFKFTITLSLSLRGYLFNTTYTIC